MSKRIINPVAVEQNETDTGSVEEPTAVDTFRDKREKLRAGGPEKYRTRVRERGNLLVRDRIRHLLDPGERLVEDNLFAGSVDGLAADAVVCGVGRVGGREVTVIASDATVKAGSWGPRSVEKILRAQEAAERYRRPIVYLIDSAGARITKQIDMFPGRRGAGRIFQNQVRLSGYIPQICAVLGPSAAGGAYVPALCDVVVMSGNGSMFLASPRMVEKAIGESVTLNELGGSDVHCKKSGCADVKVETDVEAIAFIRNYLGYMPSAAGESLPIAPAAGPGSSDPIQAIIPKQERRPFNMRRLLDSLVDEGSWLEIKELYAKELLTGFARLDGRPIGVVASQPAVKGGVLFCESADKASRFITVCDAYDIPLLFLMDVPGFMVGTRVEKQGIIRHGAKMITAVAQATVPKISVVLRKAYGAGLYAMAGPAFEPDACLALPTAMVAVMGPKAAVNAVHARHLEDLDPEEKTAREQELMAEYRENIDIQRLADNLAVDEIVDPDELRDDLVRRFRIYADKRVPPLPKKRGIRPA